MRLGHSLGVDQWPQNEHPVGNGSARLNLRNEIFQVKRRVFQHYLVLSRFSSVLTTHYAALLSKAMGDIPPKVECRRFGL